MAIPMNYWRDGNNVVVQFNPHGPKYIYYNVPDDIWEALRTDYNPPGYLYNFIKPHYKVKRVY